MVRKLKIAIIGYGWVARDYMFPAIQDSLLVELTAVCSRHERDMEDLPSRVRRFTELDDLLASGLAEAVYIATPNHLHSRQAIKCLEAGLHVLCEKPMATSIADAEAMIAAHQASGFKYMTAFDQRHHPAHLKIKEQVKKAKLGKITQARIDYACWLPADWAADNWRIDQVQAGGGALIDLAPHGLDLLEFVLEDQIAALRIFQQSLVQPYSVDDGGVIMLRMESGLLATLHLAYNRPEKLPRRKLEIIGTQQMLIAENTMGQDPGGSLLSLDAETGHSTALDFDQKLPPFHHQLRHFAEHIIFDRNTDRRPEDDLRLFSAFYHALNQTEIWH
jgi:predicted dehydrogenase